MHEYPQIAGQLCKDLKFQQHILFLKDDEETLRITCVKMNLILDKTSKLKCTLFHLMCSK